MGSRFSAYLHDDPAAIAQAGTDGPFWRVECDFVLAREEDVNRARNSRLADS